MVSADGARGTPIRSETQSGKEQNGANGLSDIEGKAVRVAAREWGKRPSFKARESVPQV